jgi:hypothetical protein
MRISDMKSGHAFLFILLLLITLPAIAQVSYYENTFELTFDKTTATDSTNFSASAGQTATIEVINGGTWPRATSLEVTLNGQKVVTSQQVNSNVGLYKTGVTLKSSNSLSITAKSTNAARVTVKIYSGGSGGGSSMSGDGGSDEISDDDQSNNGGGGGGGGGTPATPDVVCIQF